MANLESTTAAGTGEALSAEERRKRVKNGLASRHRKERLFHGLGVTAVILALGFVAILFYDVLQRGLPAFQQAQVTVDVYFDPEIVDLGERPVRAAGQSPADYQAALNGWLRDAALLNWNRLIETSIRNIVPEFQGDARDIAAMIDSSQRFVIRDAFTNDPSLLGQTREFALLASADARALADDLLERGEIRFAFASHLFTNVDSRSAPASAGLAGAFMGSLYMMLIVIVLAVPIGVSSAVYLEEFAPKNRLTDVIEITINNLAAVPSIVFGLLGAAVFINYFRLPLSAPLVGGLVLTLMTLPTIIIATRSSLRAVPPSLRQAALGLGASRTQMVFHHVLPVTYPGILTAAIIGVAQALGETAPLLLIGMNAFVANIPGSPMDQATALPVQIYLWQGNENRNFFEARTSAAIIVLLGLMLSLNAIAIFLRSRLEKRK
jgi:phosphate transport system permease protein